MAKQKASTPNRATKAEATAVGELGRDLAAIGAVLTSVATHSVTELDVERARAILQKWGV